MVVGSIVFFLAVCFGLGLTVTFFVKNSENFLERSLMRLGIGLAVLPILGLLLNVVGIPADWRIILVLSLLYPACHLFKIRNQLKNFKPEFKLTKTNISIVVMLLLFGWNFYIYGSGAFSYPYLENDDSWAHATGVKYVAMEKNVYAEAAARIRYLNPYPPAYDFVIGIVHQTNDSVFWSLKFFNALIISLSTIFFYFWVKQLSGNKMVALIGAFCLLSVPAFMSHFIWAISFTVPLYFVAFYAFERISIDKKWWIVTALVVFTTLISSPTHSAYFGLFYSLIFITKVILEKKLLIWHAVAGLVGLVLSFVFWWIPMLLRYGYIKTLKGIGFTPGLGSASFAGTADRGYTFNDFFVAKHTNMINNPIGIGVVLTLLVAVALVFLIIQGKKLLKEENRWLIITAVLFVFTLYAVNAAKFPVKLSPFRAWMLFAIPVCMLAAYAIVCLANMGKKLGGQGAFFLIILVICTGIYFTSTQQKISVNTANWPPGAFWTSGEEIGTFLWLKDNLPKGTKVFPFSNDDQVIGMDMYSCRWCVDIRAYKSDGYNLTARENYDWFKENGYEYVVIDGRTAQKHGPERTNEKIQEYAESGLYQGVLQNNGAVVFRIV